MPTARLNGIDVHFERRGTGPRVLFLNGSGSTLAGMSVLLDVLAARTDLVAHDQRGLGETGIPPGPYSMGDYAADARALLDHVGWDRARVVGVSFGGMVAQELAVTAPDRVEKLALLCTSPGGALPSFPLHELAELDDSARAARYLPLLDTRFTGDWLATHESDWNLVAMMAARQAGEKSDDVRRGEAEQLAARADHDVLDRLDRVRAPTLVAAGRYDGIAPLPNSEAIAERIPGAELRVYEGGHAFFAQDRRALPDVLDFLTS
jgi:pimeloyl-ACP methyl ester carboxylesterase